MPDRAAPAAPLSGEALQQLWAQFRKTRSPSLRARLIECYLRLARTAALKLYRSRSRSTATFADYLQYARLGLVEAVDGFDPSREASFETYSSYRIRGAMLNGLARESEVAAQKTFWRTRMEERVGPALPPVADDPQSEPLGRILIALAGRLPSETGHEDVADETVNANPHAAAELAQLREAIDRLPQREGQLIRRHYFDHCEFRIIARELTVTPGRVSQLHAQALTRIRRIFEEPGPDLTAGRPRRE